MTAKYLLLCVVTLFVFGTVQHADSARILGFFPSPMKSHIMIHCAVADALAVAGHDVTVISTLPNVYKEAKYKYMHIDGPKIDPSFANKMVNNPQHMYKRFPEFFRNMLKLASDTLATPTMQTFLKEHGEGSFDLLILGYFMNDFYFGLGAHFKCPFVLSFMVRPAFDLERVIGNPAEVAYAPVLFLGAKQPMSFKQRVLNFLGQLYEDIVMAKYKDYLNQHYYKLHFPADRYPSLAVMRQKISLLFTNHHYASQGPIRPNVPALIEIGGIQIKDKPSPLPADIAAAVDHAKQGFIYFSLGTFVQSTFLPKEKVQLLFDVLSKLPYLVIWKWTEDEYPGMAANIIYRKWLPQDDILAHPNCKLFITHGGQGGVVEAQYHGVPMVGIPLFGDQPTNVKGIVAAGFGLSLDYMTLTAAQFEQTIQEVLQNPSYANAVKKFSRVYRDRPLSARQTVVFWSEYVLRHNGAEHLKSPAITMTWWQLLSLDVIAFILAVLIAIVGALFVTCKLCCCRSRKSSLKTASSKKNK